MRKALHEFFRPTKAEFEALWKDALITFDASSLLNLCGYSAETKNELIEAYEKFKDRIILPYQVALEYSRNRTKVISAQIVNYQKAERDLEAEMNTGDTIGTGMMNRTVKAIVAAFILVVSFAGSAAAGPLEDADAAFKKGDYATALRLIRPLAEQGDAGVQSVLGLMYYSGQGVPQDYAAAASWFRKAAERGDADAQYDLGVMYDEGQGIPQDYAAAMSWYRKAAEQGKAAAQNNLGMKYKNGLGVPQDYAAAVRWYRKAAEQGYADAQNNLGVMYGMGRGVPEDYVIAHMWFNLAAASGENKNALKGRDMVAAKMTPAQIAEAQKLAREWKPTPAQH
jgi:hypothetical protein